MCDSVREILIQIVTTSAAMRVAGIIQHQQSHRRLDSTESKQPLDFDVSGTGRIGQQMRPGGGQLQRVVHEPGRRDGHE